MQRMTLTAIASGLLIGSFSASTAQAHIKMLKPAPWLNEGEGVLGFGAGDPQKGSPCGPGGGDDRQPVPLSGKITEFRAGETITVEWIETVPHPGWFRIALAENRADLKDPDVQIDSKCNAKSPVPTGAHGNVLADGIFRKTDYTVLKDPYQQQITLPNTPCDKCTIQLIQFMEDHAPGCIYYHCADIKILPASGGSDAGVTGTGDAGTSDAGVIGTTDSGAPTGTAGGTTGGGSGTAGGSTPGVAGGTGLAGGTGIAGGAGLSGGSGGATGGGVPGTGAGAAGGATGAGTTTGGVSTTAGGAAGGTAGAPVDEVSDEGCDCSVGSTSPKYGNLLGMALLALGLLVRRRKLRNQ